MRTKFTLTQRWVYAPLIFLLFFVLGVPASIAQQNEPEYIQQWTPLEEAEFHFDVFYAVVKCSPSDNAVILLNAFNEGGNVDKIGFTLEITDGSGNEATIEVEKFDIGFAEMQIAECGSDENSHLKLNLPEGIDGASASIEITYNK